MGVLFGGESRAVLWKIASEWRAEGARNGLFLQPTLHNGWDRVCFEIEPTEDQPEGKFSSKLT